jgi:hypothetical protein
LKFIPVYLWCGQDSRYFVILPFGSFSPHPNKISILCQFLAQSYYSSSSSYVFPFP